LPGKWPKFLAYRDGFGYKNPIIMTQKTENTRQPKLADKRADALRENLKKRKEQQQAQRATPRDAKTETK